MKGLLSTCFGLFLTTAATALELHLTTYGQEPDPKNWASADNYKYMLTLTPEKDFITVRNPKHLDVDRLQAERIALGEDDDYKPCIVLLPNGELIVVAFHQHKLRDGKIREDIALFRSKDGARSWSKGEKLDLLGREPYLTVLK